MELIHWTVGHYMDKGGEIKTKFSPVTDSEKCIVFITLVMSND